MGVCVHLCVCKWRRWRRWRRKQKLIRDSDEGAEGVEVSGGIHVTCFISNFTPSNTIQWEF